MAGKGIAAKYGVKPGDGAALAAAVTAHAVSTEAHMAVRDVPRSASMGAAAASFFKKGADARAASAAAAELAAKPVEVKRPPSAELVMLRTKRAAAEAKERLRVAGNRVASAENDVGRHEYEIKRARREADAPDSHPFDAAQARNSVKHHEAELPKAREAHVAAQAQHVQATADLKTANSAARAAKKTHDAEPKVATPKPEGPPTHTMTEAKAGLREHTRSAGQSFANAAWTKASETTALKQAETLTGDAKVAKLAEASKHAAAAEADVKAGRAAMGRANTFEVMVKSGHVMTAENTTAQAGTARADFAEHRAARADRLEERSGKAFAKSNARYTNVRKIGDMIPLGQPILMGHHSETRHRRDIARMQSGFRASMVDAKRGKQLAQAAVSARANRAISSDDPHAIVKLKARVDGMGNGAERRRLVERLDGLVAARARGPAAEKTIHGVRIHEADNRVRLDFGGKPPDHVRAFLKSNGFKWAPSNGSWQRQSSPNAHHYAAQAAAMMAPKE